MFTTCSVIIPIKIALYEVALISSHVSVFSTYIQGTAS
jgi:hypothetical protein